MCHVEIMMLRESVRMFIKNDLELWSNQTLTIESKSKGLYFTQITRFEDDKIQIQTPFNHTDQLIELIRENEVSVYVYNDSKELYMFPSKVIVESGKLCVIKPNPNDVQKVQRRQFFRIQTSAVVKLEPVQEETDPQSPETAEDKPEMIDYFTYDISGGGISLKGADPVLFKVKDEIKGLLYLDNVDERREVPFTAQIVRFDNHPGSLCCLNFTNIREADRNAVIRFCIKKQSEQRLKQR